MRILTLLAAFIFSIASAGAQQAADAGAAKAIFAGGCFWCVEEAFDKVPGVVSTTSGYTGGTVENPTYEAGDARRPPGHYEAVEVSYDPGKVTYEQLLQTYWKNIDPFDPNGQFWRQGAIRI